MNTKLYFLSDIDSLLLNAFGELLSLQQTIIRIFSITKDLSNRLTFSSM